MADTFLNSFAMFNKPPLYHLIKLEINFTQVEKYKTKNSTRILLLKNKPIN